MKLMLPVLLFVTSLSVLGQQYEDYVYLKNGSVIHGIITEQIPNESIRIESQGNVFYFRMDEIEKITKVLISKTKNERAPKEKEGSGLKKGYQGIAEMAFGVSYGDDIDHANETIKLNVVNGYRFNPFIAVGINTGARFLMRDDFYLVPVLADIRINVLNRKASPYFSLDLGPAYNGTENFTNYGTMFGMGIGGAIKITPKNNFNIGMSYEAIGASRNDFFMSDVWTGKYRSFGINMGFTF